jgi:CrcB protein
MAGYFMVFIGAGLGGALRHAVNQISTRATGVFPWSTMVVNITGCLAMGMLVGWLGIKDGNSLSASELLLTTGVLGGYTTFSAFSLDAVRLWQRGDSLGASLYVIGGVGISIVGLIAGLAVVRSNA